MRLTRIERIRFAGRLRTLLRTERLFLESVDYSHDNNLPIVVTDGTTRATIYASDPHADVRGLRRKRTHYSIARLDGSGLINDPNALIATHSPAYAAIAALTGGW